jgi:hypothetical protein
VGFGSREPENAQELYRRFGRCNVDRHALDGAGGVTVTYQFDLKDIWYSTSAKPASHLTLATLMLNVFLPG